MSARSVTQRSAGAREADRRRRTSGRGGSRGRRSAVLRRRLFLLAFVAALAAVVAMVISPWADKAVHELSLPLRHEDIIRQQAREKGLDPALIAGVIYTESHFVDQTSHAGATGLMQLMPQTAEYIARKSGGTRFVQGDLATPQVNIAYGSWYLRYLMRKYHGNEPVALAAYNAGEGKVDEWWREAAARGEAFDVARHIPFPETRDYVQRVLKAQAQYRRQYPAELGLK
jgi:soluble lytic murein transglycosylase